MIWNKFVSINAVMKYFMKKCFTLMKIRNVIKSMLSESAPSFITAKRGFNIQGVSAKTFEPNILVICQRIFIKFKIQIF
jgi:glucosamine 6-phosphate synthetase-like amidotransferase/phosphosugar isomerase protein